MTFKARVVASAQKIPGLWDFSALKPILFIEAGILISEK